MVRVGFVNIRLRRTPAITPSSSSAKADDPVFQRPLGSSTDVSGILARPVKRDGDSGEDTTSRSRGTISVRVMYQTSPSEDRGRRECRALNRTRNPRGLKR